MTTEQYEKIQYYACTYGPSHVLVKDEDGILVFEVFDPLLEQWLKV